MNKEQKINIQTREENIADDIVLSCFKSKPDKEENL